MKKFTFFFILTITILLIAKLHISLVRFFDPDEFVHLHYAWLLANGYKPFEDFFIFVIPVFQWVLAPLFLLPDSETLPVIGRVYLFCFYCGTLMLIYLITKRITKRIIPSLLAVIITLIFPITFDRVLEVRPDTLMMFFFLAGTLLAIHQPTNKRILFIAGLLYSISFLIYMKIAFAAPAIALFLYWKNRKKSFPVLIYFFVGIFIPLVLTFLSLWTSGLFSSALTAITNDAWAFNDVAAFSPLAALSPWPIIYTIDGGISLPWVVSTFLWVAAFVGLGILMKKNKEAGILFLIFFLFGVIYLFTFPRPHVQIFIPFVYMGSILSAITLYYTMLRIKHRVSGTCQMPLLLSIGIGVMSIGMLSFFIQYQIRISTQSQQQEQQEALRSIISAVPKEETVYDMVGSYIFRPDASYVCCHQCPECEISLSRHVGTMKENLIAKQTKFILLDQQGYVFWKPKPDDLQFILTHYLPSQWFKLYVPGVRFVCAQGQCTQYNLHGQPAGKPGMTSFDLPIRGTYHLTTDPKGRHVTINEVSMYDGETHLLDEIHYRFIPNISFSLTYQ